MKKIIVIVKNMSCGKCEERISNAVSSIIDEFEVKLDTKTVTFEGSADTRAKVVEKLESIGYEVA